jgi:glycosyltransferase involved in cell wall biosynthesis
MRATGTGPRAAVRLWKRALTDGVGTAEWQPREQESDLAPAGARIDAAAPTVHAVVPMAADGVGPSRTCARLVSGMVAAGGKVEMWVNRVRGEATLAPMRKAVPQALSILPYRWVSGPASRVLEARFRSRLRDGEIAWLWPSVSLATHEEVARRGSPIILEGINSRMKRAKELLDEAYERFGAPPGHGITDARIAEEEAKIAVATSIFAPNALVEESLAGTRLEGRFLRSSYGTDTRSPRPARVRPRPAGPDDKVKFIFCGTACVRKGIHHLLDIWPRLPRNAVLQIVGGMEEVISRRYAGLLASDRVEVVGFTANVDHYYSEADVFVFPSLEEGGPQVTYEAAFHGLPAVTSRVGGGRIVEDHDWAHVIDPTDGDAFEAALVTLLVDPERRHHEGLRASRIARHYDWMEVGTRRLAQVQALARSFSL